MEVIDPTREIKGDDLKKLAIYCLEWGRISIGYHRGDDRMAERGFTGLEIENTLRFGQLSTNSYDLDNWRYSARYKTAEIIFCFECDDDGNMLVIVTLIRKDE